MSIILNKWNLTGRSSGSKNYEIQTTLPTVGTNFGEVFLFETAPPDRSFDLSAPCITKTFKEALETAFYSYCPVFKVKTADNTIIQGRPTSLSFDNINGTDLYSADLSLRSLDFESSNNDKTVYDFTNYT